MSRLFRVFLRLRHVAAASLLFLFITSPSFGIPMDKVLATVNNEVLTLSDYRMFSKKVDNAAAGDSINEYLLKRLIEEKLILQEARNAGMDASEEEVSRRVADFGRQTGRSAGDLQQMLADEGVTMAEYRRLVKESIMSLKITDREVNAKVIVGPGEIRQFYESNLRLFQASPEKVLVQAIYLKLGENASLSEITDLKVKSLSLYSGLQRGESFEMMAMRYTDESLRKQAAVLGEFERGMLIPPLDDKIFSLREGEISEPVWTKDGVYILRAVKKTRPTYIPLETVSAQIHERLQEQKREAQFNEWMKRLWERASIIIRQ